MNKRILTLCLALLLCLSLIPAQSFAVSAPKQAVIKEAPVAGEMAFNRGGLGLIEAKDGTRYLIDRDGGIYRSGKAWMDYMAGSGSYTVDGEGYYEYPLGKKMFTMAEMEKNVKAFLEENYPMGEVVSVQSEITYPFSGPYATCSFSAAMKSDDQLEKYEFYALIDQNGLVHYVTPLIALTAGGGFPIETALGSGSEGLVRFTKEYNDREGEHYLYETGYLDLDGNEVLVFSNNDGRDPEDPAIVIDASDVAFIGDFNNGVAVICNNRQKESLIDRSGKVLLPFTHDSIYNDCGRYPVVYDEGKGYGYMDTSGLIVIPQEYDYAKGNWDNLFTVQKNGKWGVVDTDNKPVVPFEYDFMSSPELGIVYACKGNKAYIIRFEDATPEEELTPWGTPRVSSIFKDVPAGAWYETYLQAAYENGIVGGKGSGRYDPSGNLKHGEIMVMVTQLHALAKGEKFQPAPNPTDHWARAYCDYCKAEGIIDSRFDNKLDAKVTRAEMAYYFAHALPDRYYLEEEDVSLMDIATEEYGGDILKLAKAGIVTGYDVKGQTAKEFRPHNLVTRAEAAVFVTNLLGAIGPTGGVY